MDKQTANLIESYLPMSEQSFLVLLCLVEPKHGYGIMQQVFEQTNGRVNLSPSTVYTVLYKMEQDGLIETVSEIDRRKVYSITAIGKNILTAETDRLSQLLDFAKTTLGKKTIKTAVTV